MIKPDRLAWFFYDRQGERRLGVFDPESSQFLDRGTADELACLADGRFTDREWLLKDTEPMGPADTVSPTFDIPVRRPSKILCLGKNYAAHAHEFGAEVHDEPIFFTKLVDSLTPHNAPIVLPHWIDTRIDHEIELAVIFGFDDPDQKGRKYVSKDEAMSLVAGYTVLNDITARKMQGDDRDIQHPWLRSKSFDTFCPIGPWVIPAAELPDVDNITVRLHVNDEKRQESNTSLMVTDIPSAIEFLSRHTTIRPGDLLATGTPEGVGPIDDGDTVTCFVEKVGTLSNPVVREAAPQ